jgi:hypothetical protein
MQQMQLWIFWAIAAGIHNLRLRNQEKAINGILQPAVQNNMSRC